MDTTVLLLTIMTVTMLGVCVQAWRLGNEKRDVALLGVLGGLFGIGSIAAAIV